MAPPNQPSTTNSPATPRRGYIQDVYSTTSQKILNLGATHTIRTRGAAIDYPYLDLEITSHIHPAFVICNIGWQLGRDDNALRLQHFRDQCYGGRPASKDSRWTPRLEALNLCVAIYEMWTAMDEFGAAVSEWKNNGEGASSLGIADWVSCASRTTVGRCRTSSQSQSMSQS